MSEYLTDEDYWYELKERDLPLIQKESRMAPHLELR